MKNENEYNTKAGFKYFLFLGIPVIIILGVLGAYYYTTNPKSILESTIEESHESINKLLNYNNSNPLSIIGTLDFKQNNDQIEKYNFDLEVDINQEKEFTSLKIGLKEKEKTIIDAKIFQLEKKFYLDSKNIYDGLLDITPENKINDYFFTENRNKLSLENTKLLLQKLKNFFLETIDEKYLTREKTDLIINNQKIKSTKITYILNEENQKRTTQKIKEKILNDEELIKILAENQKLTIEELKREISEMEEQYKEDLEIAIYTEGLKQNIIQVSFLLNNQNIFTYTNYHEKSLSIADQIIFILNNVNQNELNLDYKILKGNINGSINIIKKEKEIEIPDVSKAKFYETLTEQEINDILLKLQEIIKQFILPNSLENKTI